MPPLRGRFPAPSAPPPLAVAALVAALLTTPVMPQTAAARGGLARFDRNGNGSLERDEAPPEILARFADLDTDGNGALDRNELIRAFMSDRGERPATAPELPGGPPSWDKVTAIIDGMVRDRQLPGAFLEVARGDQVLYSRAFGDYSRDTVLNVASATKWVTATVLMTVVEREGVAIDGPIGARLAWLPPDKAPITLGQLLSHTSGLPGIRTNPVDLRQGVAIPLAQSARDIAALPLAYPPGTAFEYGGASFQIAGALAEEVTGERWEALFQERVARPLGMTSSRYTHPSAELENATEVANPNLQAGLRTSAADYLRFLAMIDGAGALGSTRVLGPEAVAAMQRNRQAGLEQRFVPAGARAEYGYGLGEWCERFETDGGCDVVSSPGAWGTYPWIDHDRGVRGLLMVKDRLPDVLPWVDAFRATVAELVDAEPGR